MKNKLLFLCLLMLFIHGCKKHNTTYTIQSRTIMNKYWARIEQLFIDGNGSHGIILGEHFPDIGLASDNIAHLGIRTEGENDPFRAEVLIITTLLPSQEFTWFATVYKLEGDRRVSGGAGQPQVLKLDSTESSIKNFKMHDFFEMSDVTGTYNYGEKVYIGRFLKEFRQVSDPNITLLVK